MRLFILFFLILLSSAAFAQYPPAAGSAGSTAIPFDSSCFVDWASSCAIQRGFVNISDTTVQADSSNRASYGIELDAAGMADNVVVSLGDSGVADLYFNIPLSDGAGFDFAVFENPLSDTYLELAFVEVSSDGIHFFRIPAYSLTDTAVQTGGFGNTDPTKIHNLAGKYRAMFGTPFDISDAPDDVLLRKDSVSVVRLVDVVGSINPSWASRDCEGRKVNDPFTTPFASCGFDLDAVGVINNRNNTGVGEFDNAISVYPNPASDVLFLQLPESEMVFMYSCNGHLVRILSGCEKSIDVAAFESGLYFLTSSSGLSAKIVITH